MGRAEVEERDRGGGENIKIIGTSKSLGLNFIVQMALGNKTKIDPGLYRGIFTALFSPFTPPLVD